MSSDIEYHGDEEPGAIESIYPKYATAMKAEKTKAKGLPRLAALLVGLAEVALAAFDEVVDAPVVVESVDVVAVEVKVAMLMVVLRLMGIPVPALAAAPVPTMPVPMMAAVVVAL